MQTADTADAADPGPGQPTGRPRTHPGPTLDPTQLSPEDPVAEEIHGGPQPDADQLLPLGEEGGVQREDAGCPLGRGVQGAPAPLVEQRCGRKLRPTLARKGLTK